MHQKNPKKRLYFDISQSAQKLENSGFTHEQATAQIKIISSALSSTIKSQITKQDLDLLEERLRRKIEEESHSTGLKLVKTTSHLESQIAEVKIYLETKINKKRADLETKIDKTRTDLETKIMEVKVHLETKIDNARVDLEAKIAETNAKIDTTRTDLEAKITETNTKIDKTRTDLETKIDKARVDLEAKISQVEHRLIKTLCGCIIFSSTTVIIGVLGLLMAFLHN